MQYKIFSKFFSLAIFTLFLSTSAYATNGSLNFISNLLECNKGKYFEENYLASFIGTSVLEHEIHGMVSNVCKVTMKTPDGRDLKCMFDEVSMEYLKDQFLLEGILIFSTKDPSLKELIAEDLFSKVKQSYCSFEKKNHYHINYH